MSLQQRLRKGLKAVDLGDFYRVPADNRGLNYDKYFKDGDVKRNKLTEFNSNNTKLLNKEEIKASLYLTYLPADKFKYAMKMNCDDRGSFTELVHTVDCGQVSINISKPGITKGQHWHNSKWEQFIVVHGHGLIQERNINTGETVEFEVSGDKIEAIYMIPGWTHNIINLSETDDLVTVMTCNEIFDPGHPDTFFEPV